jgi:chromosome segregation ATPase
MGDAGEGLIDNDARIQERRDELEQARKDAKARGVRNPAALQEMESLRLTRAAIVGQLQAATHERRRGALTQALADIDRRIRDASARLG